MPFELAQADRKAIENVDIIIDGDGKVVEPFELNNQTLMFPPIITKDSKSAKWVEWQSGGFEPFKFYAQSHPRQLGIQFQWVTGGFKGGIFSPSELHRKLSEIKAYFYGAYFGGKKERYPAVLIKQLYEVVPKQGTINNSGDDNSAGGATFRIMNIDIKYSKELTLVVNNGRDEWYPLHVVLSLNLESSSQVADGPNSGFKSFTNLNKKPHVEWY